MNNMRWVRLKDGTMFNLDDVSKIVKFYDYHNEVYWKVIPKNYTGDIDKDMNLIKLSNEEYEAFIKYIYEDKNSKSWGWWPSKFFNKIKSKDKDIKFI